VLPSWLRFAVSTVATMCVLYIISSH